MAYLFANSKVENFQKFPLSHGIALMFLILGHSFVQRPSSDLSFRFDTHACKHFHLLSDAMIHLHGVDGQTMEKLHLCGVQLCANDTKIYRELVDPFIDTQLLQADLNNLNEWDCK